jgi:hypothetical protein
MVTNTVGSESIFDILAADGTVGIKFDTDPDA